MAWTHGPWRVEGSAINVYPDYKMAVYHQREAFFGVKNHLRQLNLKYAPFYPAKLRIANQNSAHFFTSAMAVWDWLQLLDLIY